MNTTDEEIWKEIPEYPDYPDYEISNLGRVKSLKFDKERILKPRKHKDGYLRVALSNAGIRKEFLVHRLLGMAFLGISDDMEIDHVNGDRADNRLENLRPCSHAENTKNRKKQNNNTSGFPGVHYDKRFGKYQARIQINSKRKHLGYFNTAAEAFNAYRDASHELHGAFSPFRCREELKALAERVSTLERLLNLKGNNISKGVSA